MKREYSDPKRDPNPNNNTNPMFPNFHRHLLQPYTTSASSPPIPFHHHQQQHHPFPFPLISREVDDESSTGAPITQTPPTPNPTHSQPDPKHNSSNDGATIEVQRRPRGRPPGSKNKPKPPVIITRELPDPILSPYILEISNSSDVIDSISKFSRLRNTSLTILHASGAVANVTIRQPTPNSSSTVTFHGRFDILSLDATFLGQTSIPMTNFNVSISLSIPQGQVIGGIVAGPLIAAGTVYVIAASFSRTEFQRLPIEGEGNAKSNENLNTVSSGGNEQESPNGGAAGDNNGNNNNTVSSGGGMYNLGSDVAWAPTARQPY